MVAILIIGTAALSVAGVYTQLSIRNGSVQFWSTIPLWVPITIAIFSAVLLIWANMWGWDLAFGETF